MAGRAGHDGEKDMLIELKGVHKTYDNGQPLHVLKGIDLTIEKGEFVSIMGASGSGKSTLLNILGILDNYDEGEYHLAGKLIKNLTEREGATYRNQMIGFVFQSFNLIGFKTAVENVELPLFYQGVSRHRRHEAAMAYLEKMGLTGWASHYPNEMSGGQKQRVAIARAFIKNAPIVVLDEATSALDNKSESVVQKAIENLMHDKTVFVIAHRLSTIRNANKIIVVNDGQIVESGTHNELLKNECGAYKTLYDMQFKTNKKPE